MANPVIQTRNLTKRYGKSRGIEDVTLEVNQGEIFGFIGPNGAGKSTTIRTLLGLIRKTSGQASIFGLDCEKQRTAILAEVGYLPSEVFYYDGMRARDLLNYAASFYPNDCTARIGELSERLELNLDQKIEDMSLGNRKKVGIVQGLLHSPKLIILDEPTSGLDPLMQRTFFDLIREENDRGATVLFSSHILSEVQRICDRVAIIREGRVISVQSIAQMRDSAMKRVTIELQSQAEAPAEGSASTEITPSAQRATLESLPGARSVEFDDDGHGATFLYEGGCNELVSVLGRFDLANLEISEPTLEEVFMHYYEKRPQGQSNAYAKPAQ